MIQTIKAMPWPLAVLSVVATAILLMIVIELLPARQDELVQAVRGKAPERQLETPGAQNVPEENLVATALSRPLFSPDRKPDKIDQPSQTSAAPAADLPRLAGILYSSDTRLAIFQASADDKPIVTDEGGSIAGWKIDHISAESVSISGPGGKQTLEPVFDPNAKATEPALPVGPPQAAQPAPPAIPQRNNPLPGQPFDPRRFQPNQIPGAPFRPNMPRQFPPNMPRVVAPAPSNR